MKKIENYKVNFNKKTVIIMQDFADRAGSNINGDENKILTDLFTRYKEFKFIYKKTVSATKNTYKGSTVEFMIKCVREKYGEKSLKDVNKQVIFWKKHPAYYGKIKAYIFANYPLCKELLKKAEKEKKAAATTTDNTTNNDIEIDTAEITDENDEILEEIAS